ncbi:MAG: DUF1080 domain-containing protein, partial [Candidatus Brocadiae bacterium]|nr:DUF1080 domain-containing protein [Candidatus Brocadiia bacterium]
EPANLGAPLNTKDDEQSPSLSADGLTLVFQSNRAGGQGDFDLWMSTRAATTKPFGEPVNLGPSVNSGAGDGGGCLSADRRTLYFTCDRPGGHGHTDIWQAPLLPPGAPLAGPPPDDDERWTAWQDLFDGKTLNGWHVLEGQGREKHGAVYVDDGRIVLEKGDVGTTIAWTGSFPLTDYEVELDAMSVAGRATFCEVLFRAGDHKAALSLGGERGGIIGLRQLDGRPAHDNATTRKLALLEGRWYHLRLRVLGNQIIVWADGRRVIDLATAGHELGGWNLPPHRFLMQTHRHPKSAFRAIRLRRLKPEPPRDVEGRIRLFDGMTLEGWRVIKGPGQFGAVRVDDGRLILEKGANPTAVVRDGAFPTTHYEVTLDLMRIEGSGSVSVAFPVGEMTCNLWLGTHGARALAGLGNVDGKPAYENDTKRDIQFETDRWYTARIRVIDQRIEAWLDGRKVTELTTEGHKLFASAPGAPAPFRLSTWISAAAFRNIVVRRLRPALPPPDDGGRWTAWEALFDGKSLQGWQARPEKGRSIDVRPATQEIENGGGALVWTGDFPTTGYEVSMEARRIGGNDFANLRFPVDAMSCTLVVKPDMVSLNEVRGPGIAAHAVDVRAPRDVSQWHTYRLRVLADRIGVWVDEKPVIDFRRAGHTFRCFQGVAPFSFYTFMGQGAYRNIRLRRLDVEPRAVPGKPAP